MLSRAIESGGRDPALYSAWPDSLRNGRFRIGRRGLRATGGIGAAPSHRAFQPGVCRAICNVGKPPRNPSGRRPKPTPPARTRCWGWALPDHSGCPAEAIRPLDQYLNLSPHDEQALFGKAVACNRPAAYRSDGVLPQGSGAQSAVRGSAGEPGERFPRRKDHSPVRCYAERLAELQPESPVALEALAALAFEDGEYQVAAGYSHSLSNCFRSVSRTGSTSGWPITRWANTRERRRRTPRPSR